jgi:hypothetical protein
LAFASRARPVHRESLVIGFVSVVQHPSPVTRVRVYRLLRVTGVQVAPPTCTPVHLSLRVTRLLSTVQVYRRVTLVLYFWKTLPFLPFSPHETVQLKAFTFYLKGIESGLSESATFCRRMVFRVKSGLRSLTIKQAIRDELTGGDFISTMSEKQFKIFQKYLSRKYFKCNT